ncbi:hypothetical protein MHBO_003383 [Bonamia ostreae]|uniref:Uncharacterized protein n=1 Tax=Bonamia ostreae TaxID=126728 RepID=A0ABV2AR65_9EUKA
MSVSPNDRELILTNLGKYHRNEPLFDRIRFRLFKRPDLTLSSEKIKEQVEIFERDKLFSTENRKEKKSFKAHFKFFLTVTTLLSAAAYFVITILAKNRERNKVTQIFAYDREEVIDLERKTGFGMDDLVEIENESKKLPKKICGFVNVEDFIGIAERIAEKRNKNVRKCDFLCLYRKSEYRIEENGELFAPLKELLSGLSILATEKDEKLKFVFKLHSNARNQNVDENEIDCKNLEILFEKLLRLRHFYADSLLCKEKRFPLPKYRPFTPHEMALAVFRQHKLNLGISDESDLNSHINNSFISFMDFKQVCSTLKSKKFGKTKFEFWYFDPNNKY